MQLSISNDETLVTYNLNYKILLLNLNLKLIFNV